MQNYSRDPDDLHGETITHWLRIAVRRNGSMSVEGSINDEVYALAMLDSAKDSIRAHHKRSKDSLIIPAHDNALSR